MRILYLDLDALTPSHLGCYGYHRNTSPTIDKLAVQGVRCTNVYASDAPCLPSRTALYSGRFGIHTGVVGHGGTAAQPKIEGPQRGFRDLFDSQGLARGLQKTGHKTAMVSPFGQRHAAWQFYAGFNEIHNTGKGGMESAEEVTPTVLKWIEEQGAGEDWYLHVNYWDVHTPYRVPQEYGEPFAGEPLPEWITDEVIERHGRKTGPHSAQDIYMYHDREDPAYPRHPGRIDDRASLRRMIDGYDTAIRYVDDQIAQILAGLAAQGVLDETLIIISADHGENMGELGIYGEHATADQGTCNIPMIVRLPGGAAGVVDEGLHYNVDLAPTLMEVTGGEISPIWDGRSYAGTWQEGAQAGRDELVISQCAHVCQRSVRFDHWLYVRTFHDGFHLFPREMLFNLIDDPHEQDDVAASHADICREGAYRLLDWHQEQMATVSDGVDPLWTVIQEGGPAHARHEGANSPLPAYIERLENTGRSDGAEQLRATYGRFLQG
ncbi:MAG: sulfatase-like hydrolase/transferase [Candidatus Latescibacteria bacterium]|nr:sulfatase-like hydrolase/transferase [Candidatus Latescibacterota bacterium]